MKNGEDAFEGDGGDEKGSKDGDLVDDCKLFGGLDGRQTDIVDFKVAFATEKYPHAKNVF